MCTCLTLLYCTITTQTIEVILWGTIGFNPFANVTFVVGEMLFLLVRVSYWRDQYAAIYPPWQLNLICALVICIHLVIYLYIVASSFYFRMVTSAAVKLRQYISSYTFHKNPSLHLVCILMPPLVKEILETAARHNESPNFKRESNAKRVVSAAHQVVSMCLSVRMFLKQCINLYEFVCNITFAYELRSIVVAA